VVALLDAAVYVAALPEDDPDLTALAAGGNFHGDVFDPGDAGLVIARRWQLAEGPPAGPRALLAALVAAVGVSPARVASVPRPASAIDPVRGAFTSGTVESVLIRVDPVRDRGEPGRGGAGGPAWRGIGPRSAHGTVPLPRRP